MTDAEKKMKKYTSAVERRLQLPRALKARVMSDFISSIQSRRDSGQTDAQILEELGSPKKAAAELNEQMREYTYRKSPWRYLFAACAVYGGAVLLSELLARLLFLILRVQTGLSPSETVSVGIIGGADGPTSILLATPAWYSYFWPVVLLVIGILGFLRLSRCKQK